MAEDAVGDEQLLISTREEIANLLGRYADGWSTTEGGIVTGFVAVAEVACPDGSKRLLVVSPVAIPTWTYKGLLQGAIDW